VHGPCLHQLAEIKKSVIFVSFRINYCLFLF